MYVWMVIWKSKYSMVLKIFCTVHLIVHCLKVYTRCSLGFFGISRLYQGVQIVMKTICLGYFNAFSHYFSVFHLWRKLIQFGVVKNLIRVLRKYPILVPSNSEPDPRLRSLYPLFDGLHCLDEICCKVGRWCYCHWKVTRYIIIFSC